MDIKTVRSDKIYRDLISREDKRAYFRENVLKPFKPKFDIQQVPLESNSFDVFNVLEMLHYLPEEVHSSHVSEIDLISSDELWENCRASLAQSLKIFKDSGIELKISEYLFTILLGRRDNHLFRLNHGCIGEGGIPGYITISITPNKESIQRIPGVIAHEINHNVRYQYIQWTENVSLAEWVIAEGLAENYVESILGSSYLGPWVTKTDLDMLNNLIKPNFKDKMALSGMEAIMPYIYGDDVIIAQGGAPIGLPYAAGYTLGYYLVKHYLAETGKNVVEATILEPNKILKEVDSFWN